MITRTRLINNPSLDTTLAREVKLLKKNKCHLVENQHQNIEPKNYETAWTLPRWKIAMEEEMKALLQNQTWKLMPRPLDTNVVGSK